MQLLLARHGHDIQSGAPDVQGGRLSRDGIAQVSNTALKIRAAGTTSIDVALHSEALRSYQTCELIREACPAKEVFETPLVNPGEEPEALIQQLKLLASAGFSTTLISGHEPQLTKTLLQLSGASPEQIDECVPAMLLARGDAVLVDCDFAEPLDLKAAVYTRQLPLPSNRHYQPQEQAI